MQNNNINSFDIVNHIIENIDNFDEKELDDAYENSQVILLSSIYEINNELKNMYQNYSNIIDLYKIMILECILMNININMEDALLTKTYLETCDNYDEIYTYAQFDEILINIIQYIKTNNVMINVINNNRILKYDNHRLFNLAKKNISLRYKILLYFEMLLKSKDCNDKNILIDYIFKLKNLNKN